MSTKRTLVTAALATGVVVTAFAVAQAGPANAGTRAQHAPFHRIATQHVTGKNVLGLSSKPVTVMVQLKGDPITVADRKANRSLTRVQKQAIRVDLESLQGSVAHLIRGLGGKVGASYQNVYNGMKVTVAANKVAALRALPNVVGVHTLTPKTFDNIHGIPLVGAPQVWGGVGSVPGIAGEGIKIADIDTGIDYTHADFGGPGTVAAYQAALATDTQPADPSMFGPAAPRVKGGYDFVGDSYNADPNSPNYQPVPHPDPNPLDCAGHGTHTAGTAAGSGVLADGSTYTGPYNANTVASHTWNVGPGAAPKADIYALRVFGCAGSTDVVIDAIEWAANNGMNVINMSLGSPFGGPDDPDAVASNNAANDGVIVATSAGNEGPNPYMVGDPGSANAAISTAASDPTQGFAGVNIALPGGVTVPAINANGVPVNGLSAPVKVLYTGTPHDAAHISLGCDPSEYTAANVTGDIVVVKRGTCARVARAIFGQEAGAAAVVMVNSSDAFPPVEGQITNNPDTGQQYTVTIPFLGVKSSSGPALVAADGATATLTDTTLANPNYLATASFSSGGPRSGDSALKPDVTAPGVSIASAGMGTGNGPATMSGTSMASPHVAGVSALVREAHPTWGQVRYWKAAIVNTADASLVSGYRTRANGAGFLQAVPAVQTQAVAIGTQSTATLSYGFAEIGGYSGYNQARTVTLHNFSAQAMKFAVSHSRDSGSPHKLWFSTQSVTVPAHGTKSVSVHLVVTARTAGDSSAFHDVAGLVRFTPVGTDNNGVALTVPYYLVPQALSKVKTSLDVAKLKSAHSATAQVKNPNGIIAGNADWYAWGIADPNEAGIGSNNIKSVGVQTFPNDGVFAFGLSTWHRWSNAAANEFDIAVDVNGDNVPDYLVVATDYGLVTAGDNNGQVGDFVFNLHTGAGSVEFLADAPTDSTTMAIPVGLDQFCDSGSPCLDASNPRISYSVKGFGRDGTVDDTAQSGGFNVFTPAVSTGMFDTVAPDRTVNQAVTLDPAEFAVTPPKGFLILTHDNANATEAQTIAI